MVVAVPHERIGGGLGSIRRRRLVNLHHYAAFYMATSFVWDTFRAVGDAALVLVLGRPLLGALDRAARRMRLDVQGDMTRATAAIEEGAQDERDAAEHVRVREGVRTV